MTEIRNKVGKLVAEFEETTGAIVIICRGCETRLYLDVTGQIVVINK